jgi:hypothetical protein
MLTLPTPGQLRTVILAMRTAHARSSREWIDRMESPSSRGPRRPL